MAETNIYNPNKQQNIEDPILKEASLKLYEVAGIVDEQYEREGQDIDSVSPIRYWMSVAEAAKRLVDQEYSTADNLQLGSAIELTAATPCYLLAQRQLDMRDHPSSKLTDKQADNLRYYASHYNGLLRNYAWFNPDTTATEMNQHICNIVKKSGVSKHPESFQRIIADTIRGAQHELAFRQVLQNIGEVRESSIEEDLHGIDYVLRAHGESTGVPLDVKSSENQVFYSTTDKNRLCGLSRYGNVVIYSQLRDEELNGRFFIDPELAEKKARQIAPLLSSVSSSKFAKRVEF